MRERALFWREHVVAVILPRGFSKNFVVAETSYQMLEVLSFCAWVLAIILSSNLKVIKDYLLTVTTAFARLKCKQQDFQPGGLCKW